MTNIITIRNATDSVFKVPSGVIDSHNMYIVYSKTTTKLGGENRLVLFQDMSSDYHNFVDITDSGVIIYQKLLAEKYRDRRPLEKARPVDYYLENLYPIPFIIRKYIMKEADKC